MVRAKFFVKEKHIGIDCHTIILCPAIDKSEENENFFNYIPKIKVKLPCLNSETSAYFQVGIEYYVDFTLAQAQIVTEDVKYEPANPRTLNDTQCY